MASIPGTDTDSVDDRFKVRLTPATNPLETNPATYKPHNTIPNTPLASATVAFLLGGAFTLGLYTAILNLSSKSLPIPYQLGFYLAFWAFFHWAEFAVTAGWNLEKCSIDSYLLDNGSMYHIAHATALSEYFISSYFFPSRKSYPYVSQIGIAVVILGQILRSTAMIHASTNFSHSLAFRKRDSHELVTDGVYAWFRHPSYAGFYYWALGTQLLLQNPLTFVMFTYIMWKFFYYRTRTEEQALIKFFGNDYVEYRKRVGTKIPFVP